MEETMIRFQARKTGRPGRRIAAGFLFPALCLLALPAFSRDERAVPGRFFFSAVTQKTSFVGEFDGKLILGNEQRIFNVPKLAPKEGFGLAFGSMTPSGMWSVTYTQSIHRTDFRGIGGKAVFNALDIDGKAFLIKNFPVRPYVLLGFHLPWITVRDGVLRDVRVCDATYFGLGVKGGTGLVVELGDVIVLSGGVNYRLMGFMYVDGLGRSRDVSNLRIEQTGALRSRFLRVEGLALELRVGFVI
jgi:hypothetical protein